MKLTHNEYRTPYEQCTCRTYGLDRYMRALKEPCFRCVVNEVLRRRHRRIEASLFVVYALVVVGVSLWRLAFLKGWW